MTIKEALAAVDHIKRLGFWCAANQGRHTPGKPVKVPAHAARSIYNLTKWLIYDISEHERAEFLSQLSSVKMEWPL